jgi:hypothetical protein
MILLVQGAPATGKTTLAAQLSTEFQLSHISPDNITEWIRNSTGENDRDYLKFIAHTGYDLAFDMAREMSKGRGSFVIEGCFDSEFAGARMLKTLVPIKSQTASPKRCPCQVPLPQHPTSESRGHLRQSHGNEMQISPVYFPS